jgi:hypothetical protein
LRRRHRGNCFAGDERLGAAALRAQWRAQPLQVQLWLGPAAGSAEVRRVCLDIDRDGKSVWAFDRCESATDCSKSNLDPIMKFDSTGKVGGGMINYPHGLHVDKDNNIWVSDGRAMNNGKGHTVMKFNQDGKLLMTLGKPGIAGSGPDTFSEPSDILVAPNGDIFVADGHGGPQGNNRIVKFDKDGKYIKEWGKKGWGPGEFNVPHNLRPPDIA